MSASYFLRKKLKRMFSAVYRGCGRCPYHEVPGTAFLPKDKDIFDPRLIGRSQEGWTKEDWILFNKGIEKYYQRFGWRRWFVK
ncbi:hypothetical protein QL285_018211 [Trifolium repens]|nr:hypothetical protein QL285_018211 [Trifolium repens]